VRRNPVLLGRLLFGALVAVGLAVLVAGGIVAADAPLTVLQAPLLASAGLGGLALVLAGLGLLTAHLTRERAAQEQAVVEDLIAEAVVLLESRTSS
jgi:cell division protein FtsW (lipid II flippase)